MPWLATGNACTHPIAAELAAAEDLLRGELTSEDPFVDALVKHAFRLGGKRLRPALLLLAAKATGKSNRNHVVLAAVVEMIHTATLVHDDVLDEASLRRHRETINARNDNEASVLVGDFLFTHAFALASSLETTFACQTIGRATNIVCAGELRQINSRGNFALAEDQYLAIIEAKTAELCACCCRLGAHYAGGDAAQVEALDSLRPQPGHRLPDRRRLAGPGRRRTGYRQEPGHGPGKAKADPAVDPAAQPGDGGGTARNHAADRRHGSAFAASAARDGGIERRAGLYPPASPRIRAAGSPAYSAIARQPGPRRAGDAGRTGRQPQRLAPLGGVGPGDQVLPIRAGLVPVLYRPPRAGRRPPPASWPRAGSTHSRKNVAADLLMRGCSPICT